MKKLKLGIKVCIFTILIGILTISLFYAYAFFSPKLELKSIGKFYIYDQDNTVVYQGSSTNEWVALENISQNLIDAVVSVEDKNFYKHHGFDYLRIAKAMFLNIQNKKIVQGASTISQQYIKNMYLDFSQTWKRKVEEAFLTLELEVHYSKEDILEGYLNTINFGQGNYGIEDASKYYFNKSSKDLTLEEALLLAGIPKNPSNYNPVVNYEKAVERAKLVAKSMLDNKKIGQETYDSLFQEQIEIYGKREQNNLQMLMYYQDAVMKELESIEKIPASLIDSGGLKIYTTLDLNAQETLEEKIKAELGENPEVQVASMIIDPTNGGVKALTGGYDYAVSQYNRATQAKRQVGSTMKPFLYYAALENGMTSSSTFLSEAVTFNFANNKNYAPSNYNNVYANKNITMAAALALSDNIFAVKTHLFLGQETLIEFAHLCGIQGDLQQNPSLALGTSELSMFDFASGYVTLASGGYERELHFIERIEDLEGNILYERKDKNKMILNANNVYILNEMLTNTSNAQFVDYVNPTALSIAPLMSRKYALKTGTTKTDYWTVGYNPDALMLIWLGYDDAREVPSALSKQAKKIWVNTMEEVLKDKEDSWYEMPQNIVGKILNPISGTEAINGAKSTMFYYVKGTENIDSSSYMNEE